MTNDTASPIKVGDKYDSYKVIDPDGCEDWLCAHDVRKVGS